MRSISTLYVDRRALRYSETGKMRAALNLPATVIDDPGLVYQDLAGAEDTVARGKQVMLLTLNRGPFLRKCPGTRYYRCCGYKILHIGAFCTMDCSYCILQAYFHPPVLQYYVNQDKMERELDRAFAGARRPLRIGTGEFTDSLIWNACTDLNPRLVNKFAGQRKAVLELKTKTVNVADLKPLAHNRKTVVAWSLNTERIMASDERETTTLSQRLAAARACRELGYPVAFHFDPIVLYEGCEEEYLAVVDRMFEAVSPEHIVWISLGTFRFMPQLKSVIQERFPDSRIVYGEFITGMDRKMRYFKPLRIALCRKIAERIRHHDPDVTVYFCMEDDEVWQRCMGFVPKQKGGLARMLDESAVAHCDLDKTLLR